MFDATGNVRWHFQDFGRVAFAENTSFKRSGVIFRSPLPSWLIDDDQLLMDKRQTSV